MNVGASKTEALRLLEEAKSVIGQAADPRHHVADIGELVNLNDDRVLRGVGVNIARLGQCPRPQRVLAILAALAEINSGRAEEESLPLTTDEMCRALDDAEQVISRSSAPAQGIRSILEMLDQHDGAVRDEIYNTMLSILQLNGATEPVPVFAVLKTLVGGGELG